MTIATQHSLSVDETLYLTHHVVLPPKLPQENDFDARYDRCLLDTIISALQAMRESVKDCNARSAVSSGITSIENLRDSRDIHGNVSEQQLLEIFQKLASAAINESIPFEIKAQNAGLLVSRCGQNITFESFELSPVNNAAMRSMGRLVRTFPGTASKISAVLMQDRAFKESLAYTIAKMITQAAPGTQPRVQKNGESMDEDRDTTHPKMVTEWLMNYIAALGESASATRISKNTREEILWSKCRHPWRRSPLWLLVRVTLQLLFTRQEETEQPLSSLYKTFIVEMLSQILASAQKYWKVLGSEVLYIICAKLGRRLRKLEKTEQLGLLKPQWVTSVTSRMMNAHSMIKQHWKAISEGSRESFDTTLLQELQPARDLDLALPDLGSFLASVADRVSGTEYTGFRPSMEYPTFPANKLPTISNAGGECKVFRLAAFETWVEHHLPSWVATHLSDESTCRHLRDVIKAYHAVASVAYAGLPSSLSIMYLTILELWIACDKSACRIHPMLLGYDPELRLDECQCLILPLKRQMERLAEIERHLQSRQDAAVHANPSLFRDFGHASSFAVRYYDQSLELQEVFSRIERDATKKQLRKREELADLKRQYRDLMHHYDSRECETHEVTIDYYNEDTALQHKPNCSRCALKRKAEGLDIHIYEWPLPSTSAMAKATVFELRIPETFSDWRDVTMYLLATVLGWRDRQPTQPQCEYTLDKHHGLTHLLSPRYRERRIIPLSSIKPHTGTHRKRKKSIITLRDEDVCLPNALRYAYFDRTLGIYTAVCSPAEDLVQKCMYRMPNSRTRALERFMSRPPSTPDGPSPNEVIANLSDCPEHFSIDEYRALAMLPLGKNILYSNILAQIAAPAVDFSKPETQTLMLQIVGQTGVPRNTGDARRVSHQILAESSLGHAMLEQVEIASRRVSENWESWRALASFVVLARRILSLTLSSEVQARSLALLDYARRVSMKWLARLKERASASTDDKQRRDLYSRATEVALLCVGTFDVDDDLINIVLQQRSAISMLLQCSIVVQENYHAVQSESENIYTTMLQDWRALLYRAFPTLRRSLLRDNAGLNEAVLANWAAFQPTTDVGWVILSKKHGHWLHTMSGSLAVHLNLLTGELLVNGLPLARLPSKYMQHPMYIPLFQKKTLEVVPTDRPGMELSLKSTFRDCQLHFGMGGVDMYVFAIRDHIAYDLLPSRLFKGQLPFAFVENYIHWYDHGQDTVIFRPRDDPWSFGEKKWRLVRCGSAWRLSNGANVVTNLAGNTARILSRIFGPLEDKQHIHTLWDAATSSVLINLPRLQLDFHIESHDLRIKSRQHRGMIVDPDQTLGTLVGLVSKLALKSMNSLQDRLVLIPVPRTHDARAVTYVQVPDQHHVSVAIDKDQAHTIYTYSLDTIIGRIQDSGDAQRKLFLAFLHALTSHCLPDPLTGYTGTESALRILQSAGLRSFEFLTAQNVDLLGRIAALSPTRKFYPSHLMEMQQIGWNRGLPVLSQHPYLRKFSEDIIHQAERMKVFNPDRMLDVSRWKSSNPHLDARDAIRSSLFRVCNFGGELFTSRADESYNARDVLSNSEKGLRAYTAATLLVREDVASDHMVSNLKDILLQTHFKKATVKGESILFDSSTLRFDSKWLTNSSAILTENWCNLHYTLSASSPTCNKFDVAAWLSTMAFATSADMHVIQALVAFYRLRDMATIRPPFASRFHLAHGDSFRAAEVRTIVQNHSTSFKVSAEMRLPRQPTENTQQHSRRVRTLFNSRRDSAIQKLVEDLQLQWPDEAPVRPRFTDIDAYINVSAAMPSIVAKFGTWYRNRGFIDYIRQISALMEQQEVVKVAPPRHIANAPLSERRIDDNLKIFVVDNIFAATPPVISAANALSPPGEPVFPIKERHTSVGSGRMKLRLQSLCSSLQTYAKSRCEQVYVDDLRVSCGFLENNHHKTFEKSNEWSDQGVQRLLQTYLGDCEKYLECLSLALAEAIASNGSFVDGLSLSMQHAPRISPTFWLGQLHCDNFAVLSEGWKTAVIEHGLAITQLHRARRLSAVSSSPTDLIEELSFVGHSNWQPRDFPETLLLEAESGILVRREQEFIASHMRDPEGANNIVLQLLMGGGKSSTIVPVLVVYLTDKKNLVRVIVAKSQSKQMLQMLVSKLGCLLNRRIYHMPFTRALRPTATEAGLIREIYEECIANRGVLLVQPEHILSFKLMAVESALTGQACAQSLLGTQQFFDDVSRDIVDESDENFSVKFELIYTMGSQRPIEFAPERWFLIQAITGLIPRFAAQVKQTLPDHVEIQGNVTDGRFPRVRLLRDDAADMLLTLIAKHVVEFGAVGLPTSFQPPDVQVALFNFITQSEPAPRDIQTVKNSRFWTVTTESPLLLVRGLFAGGILRFALSTKRWRVNFGLDPARVPKTLLAVPFRSKDCPSPRSEFSHPDVVILLSLLSYYYGGLTNEQLFDSFTHLQRSDQSTIHYDEWVSTATSSLPTAFRQLCGVSMKDTHQCLAEVFPCLRFSKKAIDYYLSYLVFPKAMKEFPQKLSASGWDIGATKNNPLTGFSGTNDTLHLLPLTVQHLDLPSQKHTNALVLQYLLGDENTVTILQKRARETDAEHVLSVIIGMEPEVRVLLDCGASILEQNNRQVAETWLKMRDHVIQAVVYFDDEELSVLDRTGRVESLQTSPFAKKLDSCLVYLDESHTRGTDLRLPRKYRAGVTLGQSLTKDKLTQGCMRMRKLGFGQSVVFITPEDIARKIRERTCKHPGAEIRVEDVLCWSIGETWEDLKRSMPLWAVQGERFERTKTLLGGAATSPEQVRAFLEDEAQTLEERYKPLPRGDKGGELLKEWDATNTNIAKIVQRCRDFDAMGFGTATLSEEQERELAPEIEQEKQIERPPRLPAETHRIHPALERLVHTGDLTVHAGAFRPAFQALASTSAAKLFETNDLPTDLLVTTDFMRTVKISNSSSVASFVSDSYQRPVQFVLSVPSVTEPRYTRTLVIISPFEANELRSAVIQYKKVTLHLYSPRANAVYAPLDKLTLYNAGLDFCADQIPRSTTLQLNLFAGSLYLRSFEEYREICNFLGLLQSKPQKDQQVFADGFIKPPVGIWGLQESPVPFLRCLLMKVRREGEGVELTHLGKILNGVRMERDEFNTKF